MHEGTATSRGDNDVPPRPSIDMRLYRRRRHGRAISDARRGLGDRRHPHEPFGVGPQDVEAAVGVAMFGGPSARTGTPRIAATLNMPEEVRGVHTPAWGDRPLDGLGRRGVNREQDRPRPDRPQRGRFRGYGAGPPYRRMERSVGDRSRRNRAQARESIGPNRESGRREAPPAITPSVIRPRRDTRPSWAARPVAGLVDERRFRCREERTGDARGPDVGPTDVGIEAALTNGSAWLHEAKESRKGPSRRRRPV